MDMTDIRRLILELARQRGPEKSICPSEVARAMDSDSWRDHMPAIRLEAAKLASEGRVRVTQFGREVDANNANGHIRISIVD